MKKAEFTKYNLPDSPGVYYFLGKNKKPLYIGKATSLQQRVASYFSPDIAEKRSPLIENMVKESYGLDFTETDSVLEALILETNLIRTHKPTFNTRSKDDKSYNYLVITNEEWPRVLVVRGKDLTEKFEKKDIKFQFGPYPSSQLLREALKIVRKLFQFYDIRQPLEEVKSKLGRGMIDFNRQIGLYPDENNKAEYTKTIRHIRLFFQGKKKQVIKELKREMLSLAKEERFEEAERIKRKIFALEHIQDVSLLKREIANDASTDSFRVEAYDIAHLQGENMVGVMVVLENGTTVPNEYRKFKIRGFKKSNDTGALAEIVRRRLSHSEWDKPNLIVVDGGEAQRRAVQTVLQANDLAIPVVSVVKNQQHKPKRLEGEKGLINKYKYDILLANAESHRFAITYHRHLMQKRLHK